MKDEGKVESAAGKKRNEKGMKRMTNKGDVGSEAGMSFSKDI